MMEHERESNKLSEPHSQVKHDDHESTKGTRVVSSELNPEAKHEDNISKIEGTHLQSESKHDYNKPTKEGTSSGLEPNIKAKEDCNQPTVEGIISDFSSSSSSSSSSGGEKDPFDDSFAKSEPPESPRSESTSSPDVSTHTPQWSMASASPRSGTGNFSSLENLPPTPEWSMFTSSPMRSPHIQTMCRPAGYDPNRIPSSVFSTKPTTPMEWSVASNESLFSIHMGNNSFSRDHAILMGDTKPEEWSNSTLHLNNVLEAKSNDSNSFTSNLPPVFEVAVENDWKNIDTDDDSGPDKAIHETSKTIPAETVKEKDKEKSAPAFEQVHLSTTTSSNLSEGGGVPLTEGARTSAVSAARISNESENSGGSFAFPLLVGDGGKSGSVKAIPDKPEKPKQQPQSPPTSPPKAAETNWCSCFSCWPRCC